jgi:integrase
MFVGGDRIPMKRQINRLTAAAVKSATKDTCDGYGLWLQISRYDTKSWLFRYTMDGHADSMGLGPVNTTSLAKARERAQRARELLQDGINPRLARDEKRLQQKVEAAKAMSFRQCADAYIATHRASWKNSKHAAQWHSTFNDTKRGKRVYPAATRLINDLPVATIDTDLVVKVLKPIWTTTPESASRIRGRIETVLDWATASKFRHGDNPARWRGLLEILLPGRTKASRGHHDAVPYKEISAFMMTLRDKRGVSARALEFTILTATRTSETIGAKWSEFDLQEKMWTIPAERMKAAKEHRVPLSDRAMEVLSALPREGDFVFLGTRSGKPLSNMAMLELVRGMRQGTTVHGFRSSFRDWAAEQTSYPNELCEIALAHAVSDKTEGAYRRGDMMEKRRRLMADWAAYCERPTAAIGDNVTRIREKA